MEDQGVVSSHESLMFTTARTHGGGTDRTFHSVITRPRPPSPETPYTHDSSHHLPVRHVQEKRTARRIKLEAEEPLELGNKNIFICGSQTTELLHQLLVKINVHSLHGEAYELCPSSHRKLRPLP